MYEVFGKRDVIYRLILFDDTDRPTYWVQLLLCKMRSFYLFLQLDTLM